ncbi:MAG: hypothetical protein JO314_02990 [Acidobacteria bacterium]|nr:hypothetical protein [Acidobacteriota bacterium]
MVNSVGSQACKRCGSGLLATGGGRAATKGPRAAAGKFSLWPWIILLAIGAVGYYLYQGVQRSYENVAATDDKRVATERKDAPPGLTRSEYDNRRAGQYGNAVSNSAAIANSQQHTDEINKLMK